MARAPLLQHQPDRAVALLAAALPSATRGETAALLMEAYLDRGQLDGAAEVVGLAPPRARLGVEVLVARARLQLERGRDAAAQVSAEEAVARLRAPHSSRLWKAEAQLVLGRALWEQGALTAAVRALQAATELDPQSARAFYYLALVDEEMQRADAARQAMEQAAHADPKFADAVYNLGRMRAEAGDASAVDAYKAYLALEPKGVYADDARRAVERGQDAVPPPRERRR
jgi:tetratricopeptide (TPR) repeat protein